jgi:hypothetical protein
MRDEQGHDWMRPPLRQRMVGGYLDVCVNCGVERVGPQSKEECSGQSSEPEPAQPRRP